MTSRIHGLSLSSIALPQSLKLPHRLTILFGAVLLIGTGYYLVARSLIQRAHVRSIRALYEQGNRNFAESKYVEAIQNYEKALSHNPTVDVRKEIDAGLAKSKFHHYLLQARQNLTKNNSEEALKNFEAALGCFLPDSDISAEIHSEIGAIHLAQNDYHQAQESYNTALNLRPTDQNLLKTIQETLASLKNNLRAKELLVPDDHDLAEENKRKKAASDLAQKRPSNPAQEYYELGLQCLDNNEQALQKFSTAFAFDPADLELKGKIVYQLGLCYKNKKQYSIALLNFWVGLRSTSDQNLRAAISLEIGLLHHFYRQDPDQAIASYQEVINLTHDGGVTPDPKLQTFALLLKGNVLLRLELRSDERRLRARREALHDTILALDYTRKIEPPDNQLLTEIHYQRGNCKQELELHEEAIDCYKEALKLVKNPYSKACILCDLALCYKKAGRNEDAPSLYEEALRCEFTDANLEESLEFLGGFPLQALQRGVSATLKNPAELRSMIEASKTSIEKLTGVD